MGENILYEEVSGKIIGAAIAVLNELKPGLDEKLYERALTIELQETGLKTEQQKQFPVKYKGHDIGKLIPDLIVEDLIIVDPKVVQSFTETHVVQMIGYLAKTGLRLALLINFKYSKLQWKRVVRNQEFNRGLHR
ncbi:MAG: GxxExxY protein [Kiritimatiellales bacterium]